MALSNNGTGGRSSWYPKPYSKYAACECTVAGTDWSVKDNTDLFNHMESANDVLIRVSGDPVWFKFNDTSNDSVQLADGDYFSTANLTVKDIYVTCSGSATLKLFLMGWR